MKNVAEIMSIVRSDTFHRRLLDDNAESSRFYHHQLGFADLKRVLKDVATMSPDEIFRLSDLFFTFDRVRAIIAEERRCSEQNPFYGSQFQPVDGSFFGGMVLVSTDDFTVILMGLDGFEIELAKRRTPGDRRTITFGGLSTYLKFYRARDLVLKPWRVPHFDDTDDLTGMDLRATPGEAKTYQSGDTASFGADEAFEYDAVTGAHALVLQVQMHRSGLPLGLEFDVDTRELVSASSPSQEPTRLQMLATAMRMFGRQDALDEIESLLTHPSHFVRWHAMRECLGLDAERAWPHLLRLRDTDPQPSVRRAAALTVAHLGDTPMAIAAE